MKIILNKPPTKQDTVKAQLKDNTRKLFILKPEHLRASFRKLIRSKKLSIYLLDMMSIHVYYRDMAQEVKEKDGYWIAFDDGEKLRLL